MQPDQISETVDTWVRSRWAAQPWLEERMGYDDAQNMEYFKNVVAQECDIWVALSEARVVGLLAISGDTIEHLYVHPDQQNRGVGTALLKKAAALSPDGLTLFTHQRNDNARRFYERRQFVAIRFGVSPAPESEPDVQYQWSPKQAPR